MEYLMTYGWAILIIAVVLGVLFQLGVFSGSALTPKAAPGACQVVRLGGQVSLEGECQGQLPQYVGQFPSNSFYSVPYSSADIWGGGSYTITAWVNVHGPVTTSGAEQAFVEDGWGCISGLLDARYTGYYVAVVSEDYGSGSTCGVFAGGVSERSATHAYYNTWEFVTGVLHYTSGTGNYLAACVNAVCSNLTWTFGTPADYNPELPTTQFGSVGCCNPLYDNISMANVQVYNVSLSSNEIEALYLEGIGGAPIKIQNLVGWWPINGNAQDYSGNNNNAGIQTYYSLNPSMNGTWDVQYTPP
jgi:hypothetical protein